MKILYFSRDYTTHDHRFLTSLSRADHEVSFLQLEKQGQILEDRPLPPGIQLIPWAGGKSSVGIKIGVKLLVDLRNIIRKLKPDLVQAGPIQRCAFLTALTGFKPLVSMSWGYDLLHDVNRGRAWKWATQYTLKRSAALVGDCNTIRNLGIKYGMNPNRVVTFPWGADIQKFTPQPDHILPVLRGRLGWGEETFVLLSVRSWAPLYGVDDLANAFVCASRQAPELRLFMLGNGSMAPKIHQIFQNGGVIDKVHFPGQVSQEKLPDYYRAADLYISTAHSDGTSISLLEALASGTPVLLSDIPGNQEWVVRSGEVGWLFQDGNVESLTKAILYAAKNRSKLPAMAVAARQLAEDRGDWDKNFPELFKAFEIALSL
jgi:glycosyltransferase involved in cell wall biosynthesis